MNLYHLKLRIILKISMEELDLELDAFVPIEGLQNKYINIASSIHRHNLSISFGVSNQYVKDVDLNKTYDELQIWKAYNEKDKIFNILLNTSYGKFIPDLNPDLFKCTYNQEEDNLCIHFQYKGTDNHIQSFIVQFPDGQIYLNNNNKITSLRIFNVSKLYEEL